MEIRVAIAGLGFMGQMHAQVYLALPGVKIVGIVETFPDAKAQAEKLGLAVPIHSSLESLLGSTPVDCVDICLPTDLHAAAVIEAAYAGKHIFCEKPLALTVEEAGAALAAVEKSGVLFQVGQCIRFWPEYQALEKFIKSGCGGKLVSLSLQRRASRPAYSRENWLQNGARSKGAALDLHIHDTDFILHLLGKPQAVYSVGRSEQGSISHIFTHYIYPDVAVVAEGGWDLPEKWGFQMAFQAVFEKAVVEFDSLNSSSLYVTEGGKPKEPLPYENPQFKSSANAGGNISSLGGYYNELSYFMECVDAKKKPAIATGAQALESLRTVLAEIRSIEDRREVILS